MLLKKHITPKIMCPTVPSVESDGEEEIHEAGEKSKMAT